MFIESHGSVTSEDDVYRYVEFLRLEASVVGQIPVSMGVIFNHFGIRPKFAPLPSNQQGLLLDPERGLVIINDKDPARRQRFTQAHELVEFLFDALPPARIAGLSQKGLFRERAKERLCNQAGANLLMPPSEIQSRIQIHSANIDCAERIADEFDVSLTAALVQVSRCAQGQWAVVVWGMKNKPEEIRNAAPKAQFSFLPDISAVVPPPKLRVEWAISSSQNFYIPTHKSVDETSQIFLAWQSNVITKGQELLILDGRQAALYCSENLPFDLAGERKVISLIQKMNTQNSNQLRLSTIGGFRY
jgi:Zn-dependent peptidase ImmA (M78 family)